MPRFATCLLLAVSACSNGSVDDGTPDFVDADHDGYTTQVDCDDSNDTIYPGATEICSDTIDQDCVGGDATCAACDDGAVASRCLCGGAAYENGYCCSDVWQSDACTPPVVGSPQELYAEASATCAAMPLRATGTIYYFCSCDTGAEAGCVPGDDTPDAAACGGLGRGRCTQSPLQSWGQAITTFNAMNAGDTIAMCKGGFWNVPSVSAGNPAYYADCGYAPHLPQISNPRCAAGTSLTDPANTSTCDIRDYQPSWGGTARPVLFAFEPYRTNILGHGLASTSGVRILNIEFRGGDDGPDDVVSSIWHTGIGISQCAASTTHSWLVCNNDFNHLRLGIHWGDYFQQGTTYGAQRDWLVWGNRFTMNELDATLGGPGTGGRIDANYFDNNGCWFTPYAHRAHTVYIGGGNPTFGAVAGVQVVNNQFYYTGGHNGPPTCEAGMLVGHDYFDGLIVENNIIDNGATNPGSGGVGSYPSNGWGMDFRASLSGPTDYSNARIRRNLVHAGGLGILVGQGPNSIIENNVVVLEGPGTWKVGIQTPSETPNELSDIRNWGDAKENNATVRSNTIYFTGGSSGGNIGIVVGTEGTGHVIANNSVYQVAGMCFVTGLAGRLNVTGAVQPGDSVTINGHAITALDNPPGEADDDPTACTVSCDHSWDVQGASADQAARDLAAVIVTNRGSWLFTASNDRTDGFIDISDWDTGPSGTWQGTGYTVTLNSASITWTARDAAGAPFYSFIGNNACYNAGNAVWGTPLDSTTHITSDPMFTASPTDFTPAAGSPLIGAGNAAYAPTTDFLLKPRPNPPSIGALEP